MYYKCRKEDRKEKEKCTTNTKKYAERAWPCGRAASGRVAWREALKKYAPKSAGKTCCRAAFHAAGWCRRPLRGLQNQKERAKKAEKRGWRAKIYGLAARQGSGGRRVDAASASLGAGLGVHFMPAASRRQRGQPSMHTFCRQN